MRLASTLLQALSPEAAHRAAISGLRFYPLSARPDFDPRLAVEAFGLSFANPLGLAAGFDKSAEVVEPLGRLGFGFVEVGTLTPQPQAGNPKPRLFRLGADRAIVNRMGFNNDGYAVARTRLRQTKRRSLVGVNIGPNKTSPDRVADYVAGLETFAEVADYFTINISSPNTPGLRDLHARDEFAALIDAVLAAQGRAAARRPVLVKLSPDLTEAQLDDVLAIARERRIDGLIVSNTSIGRPPGLKSPAAREAGGLSGPPIFEMSTRLLARIYLKTRGQIPLVGVGGVEDVHGALAKIEAGASLVQIYTGLIYRGPAIVSEILRGLQADVARRGAASIGALVGARAEEIATGAPLCPL